MPAINEQFIATVRDLSSDGNGVVEHATGQVFFVPGVWVGEEAEFRVTGFRKRFGFARLVQLLKPSPARVTPPCPHHGFGATDCGGCLWQFMSYEAQLAAKEQRVRRALARMAIDDRILPIMGSAQQFGYRNRAQLKSDGRVIGYVTHGSNQVASIGDCVILSDHNRHTLGRLLATLPNPAFRPPRKAPWTTLDIDEDINAEDVSINRRRPFQQANSAQNARMRQWLGEAVSALGRDIPVVELFAGSGNFTEVLAERGFANIVAVEAVAEAVTALDHRNLHRVSTQVCDLFNETEVRRLGRTVAEAGILVLDPPRDGFRHLNILLNTLPELRDVIYISCDPATFSRDLQVLVEAGFRVDQVQPLDLLPQTPHVELMARLRSQ